MYTYGKHLNILININININIILIVNMKTYKTTLRAIRRLWGGEGRGGITRNSQRNHKRIHKRIRKRIHKRIQRKNTGFTVKSIGTNEKALVMLRKAEEPTKQQWLYCDKHRNQQKSIGFTVKNIGTNEKA